jgi:hypothetical protein
MIDHDEENGSGYWPSVSDLFITLFIVAIAILAVTIHLTHHSVGEIITSGDGIKKDDILNPTNRLGEVLQKDPIDRDRTPTFVTTQLDVYSREVADEIEKLREGNFEEIMSSLRKKIAELEFQNIETGQENAHLKELVEQGNEQRVNALMKEIERLNIDIQNVTDKPPIIVVQEREEYRFEKGKALISDRFAQGLQKDAFQTLATQILHFNVRDQARVDTLEIIGHTDGVPFSAAGNLDQRLPGLLAGNWDSMMLLRAGSNNDLGLLRALAVKKAWEEYVTEVSDQNMRAILQAIDVRCYSAGQTIPPHPVGIDASQASPMDEPFKEDPAARRIEMRLTRLAESMR